MMGSFRMQTNDGIQVNLNKLREMFPNCVSEAKDSEGKTCLGINEEAFKEMFGIEFGNAQETFGFNWVGKSKSIREALLPIRKTLRPVLEKSIAWNETSNIYIEGDNLEVLKLLQESYLNKVKMIYIDPPYNTGNDFLYSDNYTMSVDDCEETSGQRSEEGNKLFINTMSNARFHSDWCNMIYSRLLLARNMLKNDGVIFISIDDIEVANLRQICDEIFGSANFLTNLIWEKKYTIANDARFFSSTHDHILAYAKNINQFVIGKLPRTDEMNAAYKNPDNDPRGAWKATPLHAKSGSAASANFTYTFKNGVVFKPPVGTFSRYSHDTLKKMDENNEIWFGKDGNAVPSRKTYLSDILEKSGGIVPHTIINYKEGGHNHEAVQELKELFGENLFNDPKPVRLIRWLMRVANLQDDDIVLDFFSGSATTAEATIRENEENHKNIHFILVQLPQECSNSSPAFKAGYKTICELGEKRIELSKKRKGHPLEEVDYGFRVFKVDSTNMRDVYYNANEYNQDMLAMLESNIKDDRTDLDLLFGCLLEWGLPLSMPYTSEQIDGCTVHTYNDGDLIACFDEKIPDKVIKRIAQRQPLRVVFRDSSFENSPDKINIGEVFKMLAPDTRIKVL